MDEVFSDNIIKAKGIINIVPVRGSGNTSMAITPSGNLVLMNHNEIQVFSHSA